MFDRWIQTLDTRAPAKTKCTALISKWADYIQNTLTTDIQIFGDDSITNPIIAKLVTIMNNQIVCLALDGPELILNMIDLISEVLLFLLMFYIIAKELRKCFGKDNEQAWRRFCAAKRAVKVHIGKNLELYKDIADSLIKLCGLHHYGYLFDIVCSLLSNEAVCDDMVTKDMVSNVPTMLNPQLVRWMNQNYDNIVFVTKWGGVATVIILIFVGLTALWPAFCTKRKRK